jgi:xanthine dehydrogenase YagS FAD-binding subunit
MRPFTYQQANNLEAAQTLANSNGQQNGSGRGFEFLAGGTTLIDLMRLEVMRPRVVLDINPLEDTALGKIEANEDGLRLGALVRMAQAAEHPSVLRNYPAIAQTLTLAASAQLRNMASLGGNALQRTRCNYFRDVSYAECNKRNPGSGCAALDGYNRTHAVLGGSDHCIATYPGDFAQALIAFDARVEIAGRNGTRSMAFARLHRLPGTRPDIETNLEPGDVVTGFFVPAGAWTRRSVFVKVRDRESYEFALASAVVGLDLHGGTLKAARIALGGVATVPWRAHEAEAALAGQRLDDETARSAAEAAFADARPQPNNAFKIALGKETLIRALHQAATMEV